MAKLQRDAALPTFSSANVGIRMALDYHFSKSKAISLEIIWPQTDELVIHPKMLLTDIAILRAMPLTAAENFHFSTMCCILPSLATVKIELVELRLPSPHMEAATMTNTSE